MTEAEHKEEASAVLVLNLGTVILIIIKPWISVSGFFVSMLSF